MRRYLLVALLASIAAFFAASAFAIELAASRGDDTVRLTDKPCASAVILERIQPDAREHFYAGYAIFQGQRYVACWRVSGGFVLLAYEDGDAGIVPMSELTEVAEGT